MQTNDEAWHQQWLQELRDRANAFHAAQKELKQLNARQNEINAQLEAVSQGMEGDAEEQSAQRVEAELQSHANYLRVAEVFRQVGTGSIEALDLVKERREEMLNRLADYEVERLTPTYGRSSSSDGFEGERVIDAVTHEIQARVKAEQIFKEEKEILLREIAKVQEVQDLAPSEETYDDLVALKEELKVLETERELSVAQYCLKSAQTDEERDRFKDDIQTADKTLQSLYEVRNARMAYQEEAKKLTVQSFEEQVERYKSQRPDEDVLEFERSQITTGTWDRRSWDRPTEEQLMARQKEEDLKKEEAIERANRPDEDVLADQIMRDELADELAYEHAKQLANRPDQDVLDDEIVQREIEDRRSDQAIERANRPDEDVLAQEREDENIRATQLQSCPVSYEVTREDWASINSSSEHAKQAELARQKALEEEARLAADPQAKGRGLS